MLSIKKTERLAVIILNWNDCHSTIRCVRSVLDCCRVSTNLAVKECTVFVVDNNSTDQSADILARWVENNESGVFPNEILYIQNDINSGYAGGNNVALKKAYDFGYNVYLLINNDAILTKNVIENLLESLDHEADVLGPAIMDPDAGEVQSAGKRLDVIFGKHSVFKDINVGVRYVGYVSGACIMFNKKVVDKIGFLEERYFMYTEDVEFCLRARKYSFRVACDTDVHILHSARGSIVGKNSAGIRKYYQIRNNILMSVDHFGRLHASCYIFFMFVRTVKNSLLFLSKGNFFASGLCFNGFFDGIKFRSGMLRNESIHE